MAQPGAEPAGAKVPGPDTGAVPKVAQNKESSKGDLMSGSNHRDVANQQQGSSSQMTPAQEFEYYMKDWMSLVTQVDESLAGDVFTVMDEDKLNCILTGQVRILVAGPRGHLGYGLGHRGCQLGCQDCLASPSSSSLPASSARVSLPD